MTHSENIRRFRREKGLTQEQLGDILGVSSQAVSKWETGDTYPDGSLLVPLADALGVSLDELFGRNGAYMENVADNITALLEKKDGQLKTARELCWQIERGLFGCRGFATVEEVTNSSEIVRDEGFTMMSNGRVPFFALFPDTSLAGDAVGDGEKIRMIFERLSRKATMKAIVHLYQKEADYLFEKEVLAEFCEGDADIVMEDLEALQVVLKRELEIDGVARTLYYSRPSHRILALLIMARCLEYRGVYSYQANSRGKQPYFG